MHPPAFRLPPSSPSSRSRPWLLAWVFLSVGAGCGGSVELRDE